MGLLKNINMMYILKVAGTHNLLYLKIKIKQRFKDG
jgi:hypothetical protein